MSQQLNEPDQTAELTENQEIVWTIKKFPGRAEYVANFRVCFIWFYYWYIVTDQQWKQQLFAHIWVW